MVERDLGQGRCRRDGCREKVVHPPRATLLDILQSPGQKQQNRVRTWAQPGGIKPRSQKVRHGNKIAKACILFAKWAWQELGATVVMENPGQSYIWLYGRPYFGSRKAFKDVRLC